MSAVFSGNDAPCSYRLSFALIFMEYFCYYIHWYSGWYWLLMTGLSSLVFLKNINIYSQTQIKDTTSLAFIIRSILLDWVLQEKQLSNNQQILIKLNAEIVALRGIGSLYSGWINKYHSKSDMVYNVYIFLNINHLLEPSSRGLITFYLIMNWKWCISNTLSLIRIYDIVLNHLGHPTDDINKEVVRNIKNLCF